MAKWKAGRPGRPPKHRGPGRPVGVRNKRRAKLATIEMVQKHTEMIQKHNAMAESEPPELMNAIAALKLYHHKQSRSLEHIREVHDRIERLEEGLRALRDSLDDLMAEYRDNDARKLAVEPEHAHDGGGKAAE